MPYSEDLANRIRLQLDDGIGISEKKMFGGLCFMLNGNMAFGIVKDELMVRVGPQAYEGCLQEPGAREMNFTGRSMKGMVYVDVATVATTAGLDKWLTFGLEFAGSLPAK